MPVLLSSAVSERCWLGSPANDVPDADCRWASAISNWRPEMLLAQILKDLMEQQLRAEGQQLTGVWIDSAHDANREGVYEVVRCSRTIVVLLQKATLSQEWCIQEIRWALHHRKNIVLVYVTDPLRGGAAGSFTDYYQKQILLAFPEGSLRATCTLRAMCALYHSRASYGRIGLRVDHAQHRCRVRA
jgi:hypothetical protein